MILKLIAVYVCKYICSLKSDYHEIPEYCAIQIPLIYSLIPSEASI